MTKREKPKQMLKLISNLSLVLLGLLWLAILLPAQAEETELLQPEELFRGENVFMQEPNEIQLTFSPSLFRTHGIHRTEFPIELEYGIVDRWQLGLGITPVVWNREEGESTSGFGDSQVSTKLLLVETQQWRAAFNFELEIPTGDVSKELGEGFNTYAPSIILARDFPDQHNLQIFTQIGVALSDKTRGITDLDEGEESTDELQVNAGFFQPFSPIIISGELSLINNEWNGKGYQNEFYITPGITIPFTHSWQVGLGLSCGLTSDADDFQLLSKIVYEFTL